MKKKLLISAVFVLSIITSHAQSDKSKEDLEIMRFIRKTPIESVEIKDLAIKTLDSIQNHSKDSVVIEEAKKLKAETENLKLTVKKSKDVSVLTKEDLKLYAIEQDKFKNITYIDAKYSTNFYPYIAILNGNIMLRLKIRYFESDWIFFDKVTVLAADKRFELKIFEPKRDTRGGYVEEESDTMVTPEILECLEATANSEKPEYRLTGKYYQDNKFSKRDISLIRAALNIYNKLKVE